MKTDRIIILLFVFMLSAVSSVLALEYKGGTQTPLRFGVGARELSLGGAGIARSDASTAPFWNPARLASAEYLTFSGFQTKLFESEVAYQYAGIAIPTLDFGTFGIGIQRLGIDDIERRDEDNLLTGYFSDNRFGVQVGYGRKLHRYQVGVAVRFEHHSLDTYSNTSTPTMNISVMRSFGSMANLFRDMDIVLSANRILGSSNDLDQGTITDPATIQAGISMGLFPKMSDIHKIELSTKLTKIDFIPIKAAAGLEYTYSNTLSLRGGLRDDNWSVGIGLGYQWFRFDYAIVNRDLGALHMIDITTTFGPSISDRREKRSQRLESEFQAHMQGRIIRQNSAVIEELISSGQTALVSGSSTEAVRSFDRALFISRNSGLDTTSVVRLLIEASNMLEHEKRLTDHDNNLDSARIYFSKKDLLNARYFGSLAIRAYPDSPEGIKLIDQINQMIRKSEMQDALLKNEARQIDSLLTYGKYEEALNRATSLQELSPSDGVALQLLKRARFEDLRNRGDQAFKVRNYELTLSIIDKSEKLFPNHQWSKSLRKQITQALATNLIHDESSKSPEIKVEVTESTRKEAKALYLTGKKAFEQGAFENAITNWERVELLIPNYLSVRDYLVQAYKYLGVEHYSTNKLEQALIVWRRAAELKPGNQEIRSYIERTTAEIAKIKELSYEP